MLFRAKIALRSVCDITPQLLEKMGVPAVDDGYNKNYTSDNEAVENQNFSYNDYSVKFYVFDDKVLMISINV